MKESAEPPSGNCNWCTHMKPYSQEKNSAGAVLRMGVNAASVTDTCLGAFTAKEQTSMLSALTDANGGRPALVGGGEN